MSARDKYVRAWIDKAEQDRRAMKVLMEDADPLPEIACFHAQQCVEKYLKAFLTEHDRHVEKTHDLSDILSTCREVEPAFEQWEELCAELTPFAVHLRYPGIAETPSRSKVDVIMQDVHRFSMFMQRRLLAD